LESETITLGQIVHSKAGRDKDKYFIVVGIASNEYVLIADGDIRKIDKPKKKKVKHIAIHNIIAYDIKDKFEANVKVSNSELKNSLKSFDLVNQSNCEEV